MSEVIATAIISVSATILTTIFINRNAYKQKKLEIENHIKEKEMDYEHEQSREDKNLYFKTFQDFASISGKTVSYVDTRKDDSEPIDLEIITSFDDAFYKAYLFLDNEEDRNDFINFRNLLRYLAGYHHPDGISEFDKYFEETFSDPSMLQEPRYIFKSLNSCLLIASKYITKELKLNKPVVINKGK